MTLRRPNILLVFSALLALCLPALTLADDLEDRLLEHLYPPEVLMENVRELGIDDAQRRAITEAIGDMQGKVLDLEWQQKGAEEALVEEISAPTIDRDTALARADEVLRIEGEIKKAHLALLITIRGVLNADQTARLREMRAARR